MHANTLRLRQEKKDGQLTVHQEGKFVCFSYIKGLSLTESKNYHVKALFTPSYWPHQNKSSKEGRCWKQETHKCLGEQRTSFTARTRSRAMRMKEGRRFSSRSMRMKLLKSEGRNSLSPSLIFRFWKERSFWNLNSLSATPATKVWG